MQTDKLKNTTNNNATNIILSGVGGQGVLKASDIIVDVALNHGLDVKKSEVHGMAQRGGNVISQVRFADKVYSPLIEEGHADIILAFEKLESIRYLDFIKPDGNVIYNTQQITPLTVFFSDVKYPQNIAEICKYKTQNVYPINALKVAEELGNIKILNTIMLGVLSNFLEFDSKIWMNTIIDRVPTKTIDLNKKAFELGSDILNNGRFK